MGDNTENGTADIGNDVLSAIAWGCFPVNRENTGKNALKQGVLEVFRGLERHSRFNNNRLQAFP